MGLFRTPTLHSETIVNPRNLFLALAAPLLVAVAVSSAVPGEKAPARKPAEAKVPFTCFTAVWEGTFELLSTRYDKPGNRVIWTLRAKKDGPLAAYEAFVADPDGVEVDTMKVKFTPAGPKIKAGTQLQAVLSLGTTAGEPDKITIRKCR
jgi:hypothetical protein